MSTLWSHRDCAWWRVNRWHYNEVSCWFLCKSLIWRLHGVSRWLLHCYESSNDIAVKFSGYSRVTTTKSLWPLLCEKLLSDFIVMSLEASSQRNCDGDFTVESLNDDKWELTTIHENTRRYMRTHDDTWDTYNFIVIWSGNSSQSGNYDDFTVESPNDNYLSIIMRRIKYNKFQLSYWLGYFLSLVTPRWRHIGCLCY